MTAPVQPINPVAAGDRGQPLLYQQCSITAAPYSVPIADVNGVLDASWIPVGDVSGSSINFSFSGLISPALITVDQNNYAPTGYATANTIAIRSDAARTITGLNFGIPGQVYLIHNYGTFAITLSAENVASAAANRFGFEADLVLGPKAACFIQYSTSAGRWRCNGASRVPYGVAANTVMQGNQAAGGDASGTLDNITVVGSLGNFNVGNDLNVIGGTSLGSTSVVGGIAVDTINLVAITQPATGATLTIADGKTLTVPNTASVSGTNTGDAGSFLSATVKTSGITYTTAATTHTIRVRLMGGGGGGAGVAGNAAGNGTVGGGGAGGAYCEKTFTVTPSTAYTIAIGAAGTAGASGGGTGGTGGDTTFTVGGVTATAKGGLGGTNSATGIVATFAIGGAGQLSTSGDVNGAGAPGDYGSLVAAGVIGASGAGGSSAYGGGGAPRQTSGAGSAGLGFGAGGSGALSLASGSAAAGGAGTAGFAAIQEYV